MVKRSTYTTNFGLSVSNVLTGSNTTQAEAANSANISQPYLNQMMTGRKKPSPEWVDIIASSLRMSSEKRRELHLAAARDLGFKL